MVLRWGCHPLSSLQLHKDTACISNQLAVLHPTYVEASYCAFMTHRHGLAACYDRRGWLC